MIDYLRESPTWRGVLILSAVVLVLSLIGGWFFADQAADRAFGNYVERMEAVLEKMEKLTVSQTQNVNVGGDAEKLRDQRVREILANRNELKE